MVFPSLPIYLDPPNWPQQQQPNLQAGISIQQNSPRPPPPHPPPPAMTVGGGGGAGGGGGYQSSIRPGSMADRARLAKIHQPDAVLKCPRCESTNTKFCYYNNYNLSQPRHFCKTCRRYWTRGGALRNVPVGGGCRRNKRSKGNNSKSPMKSDHRQGANNNGSTSASANSSSNGCSTNSMVGHLQTQTPTTQFPFLTSLQHYNSDYASGGIGSSHFGTRNGNGTSSGSDIGEFQIGNGSSGGGGSLLLPNGLNEQWRLPNLQQIQHHQHQHQHQQQPPHQFPFLTNLEPQIGLFQFGGENNVDHGGRFNRSKEIDSSSVNGMVMPQHNNTVKAEGNEGLSVPKNLLSISGNDPFWNNGSGNAWSEEVPSFTPSRNHFL